MGSRPPPLQTVVPIPGASKGGMAQRNSPSRINPGTMLGAGSLRSKSPSSIMPHGMLEGRGSSSTSLLPKGGGNVISSQKSMGLGVGGPNPAGHPSPVPLGRGPLDRPFNYSGFERPQAGKGLARPNTSLGHAVAGSQDAAGDAGRPGTSMMMQRKTENRDRLRSLGGGGRVSREKPQQRAGNLGEGQAGGSGSGGRRAARGEGVQTRSSTPGGLMSMSMSPILLARPDTEGGKRLRTGSSMGGAGGGHGHGNGRCLPSCPCCKLGALPLIQNRHDPAQVTDFYAEWIDAADRGRARYQIGLQERNSRPEKQEVGPAVFGTINKQESFKGLDTVADSMKPSPLVSAESGSASASGSVGAADPRGVGDWEEGEGGGRGGGAKEDEGLASSRLSSRRPSLSPLKEGPASEVSMMPRKGGSADGGSTTSTFLTDGVENHQLETGEAVAAERISSSASAAKEARGEKGTESESGAVVSRMGSAGTDKGGGGLGTRRSSHGSEEGVAAVAGEIAASSDGRLSSQEGGSTRRSGMYTPEEGGGTRRSCDYTVGSGMLTSVSARVAGGTPARSAAKSKEAMMMDAKKAKKLRAQAKAR